MNYIDLLKYYNKKYVYIFKEDIIDDNNYNVNYYRESELVYYHIDDIYEIEKNRFNGIRGNKSLKYISNLLKEKWL